MFKHIALVVLLVLTPMTFAAPPTIKGLNDNDTVTVKERELWEFNVISMGPFAVVVDGVTRFVGNPPSPGGETPAVVAEAANGEHGVVVVDGSTGEATAYTITIQEVHK